jgi:hypothetical protein
LDKAFYEISLIDITVSSIWQWLPAGDAGNFVPATYLWKPILSK